MNRGERAESVGRVMKLLFVCSGNTCRSPLAAAVARREAAARGLRDVAVESAGVSAWDGAPPSDGAMLVALERGLDVGAHRARRLTRELLQDADLVLTMSDQHAEAAARLGGGERVHLLSRFATRGVSHGGIADPYGGDLDAYRDTADALERHVHALFDRITADGLSERP